MRCWPAAHPQANNGARRRVPLEQISLARTLAGPAKAAVRASRCARSTRAFGMSGPEGWLLPPLAVYSMRDDDPRSSGPQMTRKRRYGDPRKNQPQESSKQARERSKREFSGGFLFYIGFAWIVFFVLWLAVGSLLVAAIVFGVLLSGGIAVFNAS